MNPLSDANRVTLVGKVSRAGCLRYSPSGQPVLEFILAAPQAMLDDASIGYFRVTATGRMAEDLADKLKVGISVGLEGQLWTRTFRNRHGRQDSETRVVMERLMGG